MIALCTAGATILLYAKRHSVKAAGAEIVLCATAAVIAPCAERDSAVCCGISYAR